MIPAALPPICARKVRVLTGHVPGGRGAICRPAPFSTSPTRPGPFWRPRGSGTGRAGRAWRTRHRHARPRMRNIAAGQIGGRGRPGTPGTATWQRSGHRAAWPAARTVPPPRGTLRGPGRNRSRPAAGPHPGGACRTATHRTPASSPWGASPVRSMISAAASSHSASDSTRSPGARHTMPHRLVVTRPVQRGERLRQQPSCDDPASDANGAGVTAGG